MSTTIPPVQSQSSPEFLFRGNAVAAGAFVTKLDGKTIGLDPQTVTTHGESYLPLIGGVSHSLIETPELKFSKFVSYGRCETFAEGRFDGDLPVTTARASVNDVLVATSPTADDNVPDIHSVSFQADSFSLEIQSTYPRGGQPQFKINAVAPRKMTLVVRNRFDQDVPLPIALDFDQKLLSFSTLQQMDDEFLGTREFFDEYTCRFPVAEKLVFGTSKIPRTPQGYIMTSFVRQIRVGDELITGNVLTKKGFGTIQFGLLLANSLNLRASMAYMKIACDPGGDANFAGAETNGIWK